MRYPKSSYPKTLFHRHRKETKYNSIVSDIKAHAHFCAPQYIYVLTMIIEIGGETK